MAKKKSFEEMSAEELYDLAKAKEAEELERQKEEMRAQREELKAERKSMLARHRKELAEIDAQIRQLGGRTGGGRGGAGNISENVLGILADKKPHSTKEIRAELEKRGVAAKNLPQTLSYLKRQGKVDSTERSVYKLV